ncbi:hypothetical protein MKW98_028607, partial [Papaver atlanticum]
MIVNGRGRSLVKIEEGLVAEKHLLPPSCLRDYGKVLLEYWANDDGVRKALHTREGTTKKWVRYNRDLRYGIELESSIEYHDNISTKGSSQMSLCLINAFNSILIMLFHVHS